MKTSGIGIGVAIIWAVAGGLAIAEAFYDPASHIHLNYGKEWTQIPPSPDMVLSLRHQDGMTFFNVFSYHFPDPISIQAFAQAQINLYYDGWQHLGERLRELSESARANMAHSQVGLYSRPFLTEQLTAGKAIAAETYYLDESLTHGVVLSVLTQESKWSAIQASVKSVLDSFWVGNQTPSASLPEGIRIRVTGLQLQAVSAQSNETIWALDLGAPIAGSPLMLQKVVYFVVQSQPPHLYGVWLDSGRPMMEVRLSGPVMDGPHTADTQLVLIEGDNVVIRALDSGEIQSVTPLRPEGTP